MLPNLNPPVVPVKGGKLRGLREGKTYSFLGVRYAEAERFEPKPFSRGKESRARRVGAGVPESAATSVGADEFNFPHRYWIANENCQYSTSGRRILKPAVKKPVMVWMHGGGFTNGSSMEGYAYDGRSLSEFGDVVVVSVNHRLNIIGTLDLSAYGPEYANSRQTGMADLVAALQWVHDNIEAFGGDPGNVMIFGQSGGGGKVVRLMHMPAAKGLFHKVSAQSGSASYRNTDPAASIRAQQAVAAATLKNLNLTGSQIDKLKAVPYRELLAAGTAAGQAVEENSAAGAAGTPIADDQYVMREFCDWAESIPVMSGTVFSEMQGTLTRGDGRKNEWTQKEIDDHLTAAYGDKKDAIAAEFKQAFPRKKVQDVLYYAGASRPGVEEPAGAQTRERARRPSTITCSRGNTRSMAALRRSIAPELAFCFHALNVPQIKTATGGGPVAMALQDKVSQAWVNFAKTGNPSQPGLEWRPYTPGQSASDGVRHRQRSPRPARR